MKITACKVNHMITPLGFTMKNVTFSWVVEGAEVKESRIIVRENDGIVYDTGWNSLNSLGATLDIRLLPRKRYEWVVSVRNNKGEAVRSEVNYFETGKLDEAWTAKWIGCFGEEKRLPIFTKKFAKASDSAVVGARLYICGLGLFEASLNGEKIGEEYLAPGCNAYNHFVQVYTYDVTSMVMADNKLSVLLGDGWYMGRFDFENVKAKGFYGDSHKLIAELHISYEDGSKQVVVTDESWHVERSNILFSGIYDGEIVDDTLEACEPEKCVVLTESLPKLMDRLSLEIKAHEELAPKLVITPKGEQVLDIGQNMAGIFRFRVHEDKGTKIHLQVGEVLQDDCFYRDNLRTAKAEYIYISDGEEHVLVPHFTFYGYRYVKVEGIKDLRAEDFTAVALYSDMPIEGRLVTGNELVNKLISNTTWGMKSNFIDTPTDCPQRDERMGWTGDAQAFSETACFLAKPYAFYRKYLYDMACEQSARGGLVPDVVPAFSMNSGSAVWGDATCIIPWNMYLSTGDMSILKEHYDSMVAWLRFIEKIDGDNHEWRSRKQYGDWLALDMPGKGAAQTKGATDEGFIADVYYRKSAIIVAKTAKLLGKTEDAAYYSELADKLLKGIQEEYFSVTGRCCVQTQTAALLTLKEGLHDKERAKASLKYLLEENNNKLATGFIGTTILCETLTECGMTEEAFLLLLNEEYPGWLNEIKLGATTIWERWNSLDETGHISSTGMNSLNHYTYGSIVSWLWKDVVGLHIKEAAPGFKEVEIKPQVNWKLRSVEAVYPSAAGTYEVSWRAVDKHHLKLRVLVPCGCKATIYLPLSDKEPINVDAGVYEYSYETICSIARVHTIDEKLKTLLAAGADVKAVIQKEFLDNIADHMLGFIADYPLSETMRNWGYSAEFMDDLNKKLANL